jgi:hypothetical protein
MLGFGCKLGPSSSHAQERCAEFGCFRGLSKAEAGFRMPSASHWIDGHLTLLSLTPYRVSFDSRVRLQSSQLPCSAAKSGANR